MANGFLTGITEKFPKEILEGRMLVEGNVIACLMKDMLLLDDSNLNADFFISDDGRFYFNMLQYLRDKKFSSLDNVTIMSTLKEEAIERYQNLGGWDEIEHMINIINLDNYDTYLDTLFREDTICRLYLDGFPLTKEMKGSNGKSFVPLKKFRKMTNEEVLDWYEAKLTTYNTAGSSKITCESTIEFDDDFIQSCQEGEEQGIEFTNAGEDLLGDEINCFPYLSRQIMGLLPGSLSMMGAYSSCGKTTWAVTVLMALASQGKDILILSNEETITKFKVRFLIWILYKYNRYTNVTKRKLTGGQLTEEDKRQIALAREYWNENYSKRIHFVSVSEVDMNLNKKIIRKYILRYGVEIIWYDTFKIDFNGDLKQRSDLNLIKDSQVLDTLAKKYNVIICASIQLSIHTTGTLFLDANTLSNAKQIKEILENLFLMRTVYNEELDPQNKRYYCSPFQLKKKDGQWVEEPFEANPALVWRMLFPDKTRSGKNSEDNGVAYLLQYDGDHCIFKEVAQCRPKHGNIGIG